MELQKAAKNNRIGAINDPSAYDRFRAAQIAAEHGNGEFALTVLGSYLSYLNQARYTNLLQSALRTGCTELADKLYDMNPSFSKPNFRHYNNMIEEWLKEGQSVDAETLEQYDCFIDHYRHRLKNDNPSSSEYYELYVTAQAYDRPGVIRLLEALRGEWAERLLNEQAKMLERSVVTASGPYYQDRKKENVLKGLLQHYDPHKEAIEICLKRHNTALIEIYENHAQEQLDDMDVLSLALDGGGGVQVGDDADFLNVIRSKTYVNDKPRPLVHEGIRHEDKELIQEGMEGLEKEGLQEELSYAASQHKKDNSNGLITLLNCLDHDNDTQDAVQGALLLFVQTSQGGIVRALEAFKKAGGLGRELRDHEQFDEALDHIAESFNFETFEWLDRHLPLQENDRSKMLVQASQTKKWRRVDYLFEQGVQPENPAQALADVIDPAANKHVLNRWFCWADQHWAPYDTSLDDVLFQGRTNPPWESTEVQFVVRRCFDIDLFPSGNDIYDKIYSQLSSPPGEEDGNVFLDLAEHGFIPREKFMEKLRDDGQKGLHDTLFGALDQRSRNALDLSLERTKRTEESG